MNKYEIGQGLVEYWVIGLLILLMIATLLVALGLPVPAVIAEVLCANQYQQFCP